MPNRLLPALLILLSGFFSAVRGALPSPDPDDGGLTLPQGFRALTVADNLGRIRFISVATNGDIYIKKTRNGLMALRDSKGDGRADVVKTFGNEFGPGTGVAVRNGWLYFSTDDAVYRYKLAPGELVPTDPVEPIVVGLPPGQRQHEAKPFAFDGDGRLYVEVGCPSNASGNPDRAPGSKGVDPSGLFVQHGGFWRFDANRTNQDQLKDGSRFSTGMRHALSVDWNPISKSLFVCTMGRDQLNTVASSHYTVEDNAQKPAEEFHVLKEGSNFGWPYTYWDPIRHVRMIAPEFGGDNDRMDTSGKYPRPLVEIPAHWAPLQMTFYGGTQFPQKYHNGAFIASHGSWNRAPLPQAGYNVVFIPFDETGMPVGNYFEVFADGFAGVPVVRAPGDARHRPCGLATGPDGSLYVADSQKGRVWRIFYTGEARTNAPITPTTATSSSSLLPAGVADTPGARLYAQICATCHMADGNGVANLQPPMRGSAVVAGDPDYLIRVVLEGATKVLPVNRPRYSNTMPPMNVLTDEQIATVLTFVREQFGNKASAINAGAVAKVRTQVEGKGQITRAPP